MNWRAQNHAHFTRHCYRIEGGSLPRLLCSEPYFVTLRRPCQSVNATPLFRKHSSIPVNVNNTYRSSIVPLRRMTDESDQVASRREADVTDPAGCLIQHLVSWVFETIHPSEIAHNDQA